MPERGEGALYNVSPPPQQDAVEPLRQWCNREFERIAFALGEGRVQYLRLDVWRQLPMRPVEGMIAYFAADVAGTSEGSYEYDGAAWRKL